MGSKLQGGGNELVGHLGRKGLPLGKRESVGRGGDRKGGLDVYCGVYSRWYETQAAVEL